jgi:hypothetical protein
MSEIPKIEIHRVGSRRPAVAGELFPVGTPIHVGCGGEVVGDFCELCGEAVEDR